MIDIRTIEKVIKCQIDKWQGNCYAVSCLIIDNGLIKGKAVYGHYLGEINIDGFWGRRANFPFIRHGWILTDNNEIVDPTRWSFLGVDPYIAVFDFNDNEYQDYDEGGQRFRIIMRSECPKINENDKILSIDVDNSTAEFVDNMLGDAASYKNLSVAQLGWLASAPYEYLGIYMVPIYSAISKLGLSYLIPLDHRVRANREHCVSF